MTTTKWLNDPANCKTIARLFQNVPYVEENCSILIKERDGMGAKEISSTKTVLKT